MPPPPDRPDPGGHAPAPGPGRRTDAGDDRPDGARAAGLATCTVLVVDDEPAVAEVVRRILVTSGCTVLVATSAEEALRLAGERAVDLLLTDLVMPGRTGTELSAELRRRLPGLPTLFMTGYDLRLAAGELPADAGVIGKPFTAGALLARVRAMLEPDPPGIRRPGGT